MGVICLVGFRVVKARRPTLLALGESIRGRAQVVLLLLELLLALTAHYAAWSQVLLASGGPTSCVDSSFAHRWQSLM